MAIISQKNLFSWKEVEAISDLDLSAVAQAGRLSLVLEAIGDEGLMQILEKKRKGKRDDYPIRAVWNSILAGIVYQHVSIESFRGLLPLLNITSTIFRSQIICNG